MARPKNADIHEMPDRGDGGALTHRTGCTEVWGTFPRLGNHREDLATVRRSRFMRQTVCR